jgi:hypothetical protein
MKTTAHNLAQNSRWSSFHAIVLRPSVRYNFGDMSEQNEIPPKQNYKWPCFVLAAVLLFIVLAVAFVGFKARQIEHERDFNAPLPGSPAR